MAVRVGKAESLAAIALNFGQLMVGLARLVPFSGHVRRHRHESGGSGHLYRLDCMGAALADAR